eukprot:CAMPEP_0176402506 /NCGR_PEP_ID=MMETSP0126-20121128/49326_1 /TAXON_ID=141414 ORGANISM="Strombidinopsis acuminatum, Strain SPMC142" /NCGR_SAMPLE_ID=MMETSP0126 /ASSEMBLY_ACC=CAM_ASM_000229 /LENGTH=48 /DNA_ID= /DNA_START= /DNA_END= /DNA_ORIENTATION=
MADPVNEENKEGERKDSEREPLSSEKPKEGDKINTVAPADTKEEEAIN